MTQTMNKELRIRN